MLEQIIRYSIQHKLIVLLFTAGIIGFGTFSLLRIPIGAVPDATNNQVQVITTSRNLATQDVERFLTYPVELEMANLPGVTEIRSISKFGLSVVTVVFEDGMGTYLPRQLIAEKIKMAEERIPAGFGKPFMGPVTTGLGEIYQYIIDVDPAYQDRYSITDLRTIQDWTVKRSLSGIPGVVEVNTWGGRLKQYEVAVNPEELRAMDISLGEVYEALEKNNGISGGGYIEKSNQSYFVRGEGLAASLQDIEEIVVANRDGRPVYVKDIARVGFGSATRFGAITGNGQGEKVLGQVMMLKGANSKAVIEAVKARVAEIAPTLPPGIRINPFLERSELIAKTTFTIGENLILGCLIVIFVVVLLLGNFRSGLVVASVIPLCLLFALSLMYIFGVDANLMSLGAIDFGIIIDGAVIIVEFIAFRITQQGGALMALPKADRRAQIDQVTFLGASKMMHSAIFGQIIILIVFIPILSLANVEGKMFRPMALAFCFALLGAIVLCFTYVPVAAALFLKPSKPGRRNISTRLVDFLASLYAPTLRFALRSKALVIGASLGLLVLAGLTFMQLGGEFVPTLDEGDFVIQPALKTGTSLGKTIELTTQMEQILLEFPEVDQVVSRIGAAEVPTDPMSMEESDVIIKLKPKHEWTSSHSKDGLAELFKEALSVIPGVEYEFTQPIEMRFNELITGVRADLAVKVFGEDLDKLYEIGLQIEKAVRGVEGASDIAVEKIVGLPQMSVTYDRPKIARYGLNVEDLNKIIGVGFAGMSAGTIFEGEKQFDLVLRYDEVHRQDLESLKNATIDLPNGQNLPLREFAAIEIGQGPAKISRDNTRRRMVVGINVRNRDLESVVEDVQAIVAKEIDLPPGYTVEYGGQFENLRTARARLSIAVPIALALIFVLLYLAFNSIKEALLIFTAIPLSAVGGVLFLYLRGMPFSISAGVGFIALFGIAVLNGIVLIEQFKELKAEGMDNTNDRIIKGALLRLRPVLLTAGAAALGFLPMAVSGSAGAEVQRPLATVVIGGLVTATLLTLLVLPVLYAYFDRSGPPSVPKAGKAIATALLAMAIPIAASAQAQPVSMQEAVAIALQQNKHLQASQERVAQQEQLVGAAVDIDKTNVYYSYDQNNIAENGLPIRVFGLSQTLAFPSVYSAQKRMQESRTVLARQELALEERMVAREVSQAYCEVLYWQGLVRQYTYLDSLYGQFAEGARRRFEAGESNYLEKLTAENKLQEIALLLQQSEENVEGATVALQRWMQSDSAYVVPEQEMERIALEAWDSQQHPGVLLHAEAEEWSRLSVSLERRRLLPDLELEYFRGTNNGPAARAYNGFQAGVTLPLWNKAQRSRIEAAETGQAITRAESEDYMRQLQGRFEALVSKSRQFQKAIDYYESTGLELSKELSSNASAAYQAGEIDYLQFIQLLESARQSELGYLHNLLQYNLTILEANYIIQAP